MFAQICPVGVSVRVAPMCDAAWAAPRDEGATGAFPAPGRGRVPRGAGLRAGAGGGL